MFFFNNLYGAYYSFLMKLRRINKLEIEEFQAMALVTAFAIEWVGVFFATLKKLALMEITYIPSYLVWAIIIILFGLFYFYFQTNKARTSMILENYGHLSKNKKMMWQIIAAIGLIAPLFLFSILL
jgi:hypothetical protein